jgi:hypothetical protein
MTPGEAPPARSAAAQAPASRTTDAPEARSLIVYLPWPSSDGSLATAGPERRGVWSATPLRSQRRGGAVLVIGHPRGVRGKSPGSHPGAPLPPDSRQGSRRPPRRPPPGDGLTELDAERRGWCAPFPMRQWRINEARTQVLQSLSPRTGPGMRNRRVRCDCSPRGCRTPRGNWNFRGLWSYRRTTIFPSARRSASMVIPSGASPKPSSAPMSGSISPSRWRSTSCSWMSGTTWGRSRR